LRVQRGGAGVLADPQARLGMDDAGGVVGLVAAERRYDQRHCRGQRLDDRTVTAVRDHDRAVGQHIGVTRPPPDRHVLRSRITAGSTAGPVVTSA